MGNVFSTGSWASAMAAENGQAAGENGQATVPLFLSEIDAEPATWSQESKCVTIQRFFGWLPDSTAEKLKQEQKAPVYIARVVIHDITTGASRAQAIVIVQRVYRRYRLLLKWHIIGFQVLELARDQLEERTVLANEEELLANFRQFLSSGFSAQKVSITGALKNVQLQLVLNADREECYLTWTPSRKREARIHLHDIQEVVPVLKEGNKHAPRLANKVSHRRGLIIVCKSHHRGRVVLQMGSKRERKILLLGFRRLLDDLDRFTPNFDDTGAIRKRLPRRKSAIDFFDRDGHKTTEASAVVSPLDDDDGESADEERRVEHNTDQKPTSTTKRPLESMERLYETRFDESPTSGVTTNTKEVSKPSLLRRSSMTL